MTTATETQPTITLSNFRVTYRAAHYEDGKVLYDPYCAILADDAALDGAEVRVFDVPDVDEGQLAAAMFACDAMNQHAAIEEENQRLRQTLKKTLAAIEVIDFSPIDGAYDSIPWTEIESALTTTTSK